MPTQVTQWSALTLFFIQASVSTPRGKKPAAELCTLPLNVHYGALKEAEENNFNLDGRGGIQ